MDFLTAVRGRKRISKHRDEPTICVDKVLSLSSKKGLNGIISYDRYE